MQTIRFTFSKTGAARYLSHLDLVRCMTRALRRTGLDVKYTEGFNPHQYITFALPLPLGQEGLAEKMDVIFIDGEGPQEAAAKLGAALPEGIRIVGAAPPVHPPARIRYASYDLTLDFACVQDAQLYRQTAVRLVEQGALAAQKTAKKGRAKVLKTIDLCEHLQRFEASVQGTSVRIGATLSAGIENNVNPFLLTGALERESAVRPETQLVVREVLLMEDLMPFS